MQAESLAFVLHRRPFRDNSQIVELFTREAGRIAVMGRSSGKPGRGRRFDPFVRHRASWRGRGELPSLSLWEEAGAACMLPPGQLAMGFYLNELLMRLTHRDDPHPDLFDHYSATLEALLKEHPEAALRRFEVELLDDLGYGLDYLHDAEGAAIDAELRYHYAPERGLLVHPEGVEGAVIFALAARDFSQPALLAPMKQLMRQVMGHLLGPKPLKSRELFSRQRGSGVVANKGDGSD